MKFPLPLKYTALIMAAACGGFSVALAVTVGATGGSPSVANTGRAAYSIPIDVPPAPLGSQPKLALVYNSEAGNGILGKGWSLQGLSEITRVPATLEQDGYTKGVTLTSADKYALDGLRLIAINGVEYRTEIDTMARVVGPNGVGFTAQTAEGITKTFSPVSADGVTFGVLKWVVTQATDRGGNTINYAYNSGSPYGSSVSLINQITYPNGSISFLYEDRTDKQGHYLAGALLRLDKRLTTIVVSSSSGPWYTYTFTYKYSDVTGESLLAGIQDSRLNGSVALTWPAADISPTDAFPATPSSSVAYVPGGWAFAPSANPPQDIVTSATGLDGGVRFLDLNGDGYVDILYSSGGVRKAYLNTKCKDGSAPQWVEAPQYAPPVNFYYEAPAALFRTGTGITSKGRRFGIFTLTSLSQGMDYYGGVQFQDLNGDGLPDILYGQSGDRRAYLNNTNHAVSSSNDMWVLAPSYAPTQDLQISFNGDTMMDNGVRLVDVNGDGLVDFIYARDSVPYEVHLNTGSGWSSVNSSAYWPKYPIAILSNGKLVDNGVRFIDVNGDGLVDELIGTTLGGGYVLEAHMNTGSGFDAASTAAYAPKYAFSLLYVNGGRADGGVQFVDVNGDGLPDMIVGSYLSSVSGRNIKECYLNTGAGWSANHPEYAPQQYLSYAYGTNLSSDGGVRFEDVNGDGLVDYVYSSGNNFQHGRAVYLNTGAGWATTSSVNYTPSVDIVGVAGLNNTDGADRGVRFVDFSGDGRTDLVAKNSSQGILAAYLNQAPAPDLMASVQNEFGVRTEFSYNLLTNDAYYLRPTAPVAFPIQNFISPKYVTTKLRRSDGIGGMLATDYTYAYGRTDVHGRGFLGFQMFESYDEITGYATTENVSQAFPWIGMTNSVETDYGASLVSKTTNTLAARSLNFGYTTFPYYSSSIVQNARDATSITTSPTYDDYGNPTQTTVTCDGAAPIQTTNQYTNIGGGTWQIGLLNTHTVNSAGVASQKAYTYDNNGLVATETDGIANPLTTTYARGAGGVITGISKTGAGLSGHSESFSNFAACGLPQSYTNAVGHSSSYTYDNRFGLKTSETDPNGLTSTQAYDDLGRETAQTSPDGSNSTTAYSADSSYGAAYKAATTDVSAPDTTVYWDALDRVVAKSIVGGGGAIRVAQTTYFNNGLMQQTREPGAVNWTTFTYDWLQRASTTQHPSGVNTTYSYSGTTTGLTTTVSDSGHGKTITKNSLGQVMRIDTDGGAYVIFAYDGNGYPTQTNASGAISNFGFDDRGFKTSMNDADLGAWSYQYDALGNNTRQQDAAGNVTTTAYDALDRMTSRTVGGQTSTWTYDGSGPGNKLGKLSQAVGPAGYRKSYYYDALARPYLELSQIDGRYFYSNTTYGSYSRVARVDYFWRPLGLEGANFVGHNLWNSFGLLYDYTADGYTSRVYDSTGRDWWKNPSYDNLDKINAFTYGNGISTTASYDTSTGSLLRTLSSVQDLTYAYDIFGNLTSRVDAKRGLNDTYHYDSLNRLTDSSGIATGYDNQGNILTKGGLALSYGGPRPHAVTSAGGVAYTYDANGNLLGRGASTVSWTAFNQPLQMQTGGTTSTFAYNDSFGRVMETNVSGTGTTKKYYIDGAFEQFVNPGSTETRIYVNAPSGAVGVRAWLEQGAGVATTTGNRTAGREEVEFYHTDNLGSITTVTDSNGQPMEQYSFESWGARTPYTAGTGGTFALVTDHGYTGHEMLDAHALIHMNGRIYDPLLGRMLSPDPFVQQVWDPQNYNRYSYVLNNPMVFMDPSGKLWFGEGLTFKEFANAALSGLGTGIYNVTIASAVKAGNEAGQMYIDARASGSSGLAAFGYATSQGLGRMTGGMGLVEFYTATKVVEGSNGSLQPAEFDSLTEWGVHGAASYAQALTTATGVKVLGGKISSQLITGGEKMIAAAAESGALTKGGTTLGEEMGILRDAAKGTGNYGLGTASRADAVRLGESWVGDGYKVASDGKTLISKDGLRQFRPPSLKSSSFASTGEQANFELRSRPFGPWAGNGHLNITP